MILLSALLLMHLGLESSALAKTANVEWTAIAGAVVYELELVHEGDTPKTHRISKTEWKGDLPAGLYRYRVRGVDRFKRPGKWSLPQPLVLMPSQGVELESPPKGTAVQYFGNIPTVPLKWKTLDGVERYRVQVFKNGGVVLDQKVKGNSAHFTGQADGDYRWKVSGCFEAGPRHWETEASSEWAFEQKKKSLIARVVKYPRGTVPTPKSKKLKVQWTAVEGATLYELKVWKVTSKGPVGVSRELAALNDPAVKTYHSPATSLVIPVQGDGPYRLQIRALAAAEAPANPGAALPPPVEGPTSVENFALSQHALYSEGSGYVALSAISAPYVYNIVNSSGTPEIPPKAFALVGRLSGEYWFSSMWGMGAAAELSFFSIQGRAFLGKGFELNGKARINFGKDKWGWIIQPKVGVEMRDMFAVDEAVITDPTAAEVRYTFFGPAVGFDIRKQIFEKFSLSAKFNYFIPVIAFSSNPAEVGPVTITSDASYSNVSFGLQAAYWLGGNFGIAAGALAEFRSISVDVPTRSPGVTEQISMPGVFFFGSVIYSFGR